MNNQYNGLISKIEVFIRKYYKNQLIKGGILSLALIISFFLLAISLENIVHFGIFFRRIIFYLYIVTALTIIIHYIIRPIAGIIRIGKRLTNEEAAKIIGSHFSEINDKLLNTLQLQSAIKAGEDNSIIEAAIEQKAEHLSPIPFQTAINFSVNKKYFKFILPPFIILLIIGLYSPDIIIKPSNRLIKYNEEFIEKAPFQFNIINDKLVCLQSEDFLLNVNISGEIIPSEVFIIIDNYPFRINKKTNIEFSYLFKKMNSSKEFHFKSGKFISPTYKIEVKPSPKIISFSLKIDYPKYLKRKTDIIKNAGDISIPEGSKIQWTFNTKDITKLSIILPKYNYVLSPEKNVIKSKSIVFRENFNYSLHAENEFSKNSDTLNYSVEVIKDQYPRIKVQTYKDSLNENMIYFQGNIQDDYGFSSLKLKWKTINQTEYSNKTIDIQYNSSSQRFYYFINIDSLGIEAGASVNYFFEVKDNDRVNGPKSAKSIMQALHKKSAKEIDSLRTENSTELKNKMEETLEKAQEINKKTKKLNKELVNKKNLDWKDKKQLKELVDEYNKMLKSIEEIKQKQEKTAKQNKELSKEDERLLEKQKQLQELFDKLMTPEMKEMLEQMQKMMEEEIKKEDAQKMLDKMEIDNKDLEKQLDRDLEIFKQMEFDQKLQEAINQLDSIQKKQEKLSKDLEDKKIDIDKAKKEQEKLNKDFKDFKKKLDDAKKANKELEKPNDMQDFDKEKSDIEKKMDDSSDKLDSGKKKSASKMQKSASDSMKELSKKLQEMQMDMESQSNEENMEDLRDILYNLIEVSFKQEELLKKTEITQHTDPKYPKLISEQKKIQGDFTMIEDSLLALSKRQPSISPMVSKELSTIDRNMELSLNLLLDMNTIGYAGRNKKKTAVGKQQIIMTSVNNLALMLSESLEQMQQQQMQSKSGKGKCKKPKPGKSGGSMKSLRQMQQALNKQMKRMQQKMKEGKGPKGKKKGKGKQGNKGEQMSEEMARMAAQQELIRKKLQQKQNALKKAGRGKEAQGLNKAIKDMEQNETELVNSMILRESMMRQQEIVTRLLEAEKAEREQKQEESRESSQGVNVIRKNPPNIQDFIDKQKKEVELLKTIPPNMKPFYKNKVNIYFEEINKINNN